MFCNRLNGKIQVIISACFVIFCGIVCYGAEKFQDAPLKVIVTQLEEKLLTVQCVDKKGLEIRSYESITPSQVMMFVYPNWEGVRLKANVVLHPQDIVKARKSAIQLIPYVELLPDDLRHIQHGEPPFLHRPVQGIRRQ